MLSKRFPSLPPGPGLHQGVPMDEYHRFGAVSASMLKACQGRLRAFRYWLEQEADPPTAQMRMGTALHALLLEPDRAREDVVEVPGLRWGSGSEAWGRAASARPGRHVVCEGGLAALEGMAASVRATARIGDVLDSTALRELTMVWEDETGILCRGRLDAVIRSDGALPSHLPPRWAHYLAEGDVLFDLKATRDSHYDVFGVDVYRYGYHVSAAMYRRGYEALTGRKVSRVVFAAAEWERPWCVAAYALDPDYEAIGRMQLGELLKKVATAYADDAWVDDEAADLVDMDAPAWVHRKFEDGLGFGG